MLFIKNYYNPVDDALKLRIRARTGPDDGIVLVSLATPGGEGAITPLFGSIEDGLFRGIKKSVEYIGKKTNTLVKDDTSVNAAIFDDRVSEIALYIKDTMISLEPAPKGDDTWENIPVQLNAVKLGSDEKADPKKRYLRDMIVFVVNKGDVPAIVRCDERNIVGEPIFISGDYYDAIIVIPKWPAWGNLKFPAYISVEIPETKDKEKTVIGAVKLGCHTENGSSRNQVVDVDVDEATKYLDESDALKEKKNIEAGVDKLNKKFGTKKKAHPENQKKGKNNAKNGNSGNRTGVPPMYKTGNKGGGKTRPAQNQQKNYRRSGNR